MEEDETLNDPYQEPNDFRQVEDDDVFDPQPDHSLKNDLQELDDMYQEAGEELNYQEIYEQAKEV